MIVALYAVYWTQITAGQPCPVEWEGIDAIGRAFRITLVGA